ncbi:MAG: methionine synthase [Sphaerochaeta sp.]|nr:MAG: methionine synthase [Sphaerochaeta sp.]
MGIREEIRHRVLLLDGAMGTMIQSLRLPPSAFTYRGRTAAGLAEVLNLTQGEAITSIHRAYIEAGADIIETNTFNANRISLSEYNLEDEVAPINRWAVALAREASRDAERRVYIAGVLGPTASGLSFSAKVDDPTARTHDFDFFIEAYREQAKALIEAGCDLLLIETVFDTLVAKSAIIACREELEAAGKDLPIMVSVTFSDGSGRTLSGQSLGAFIATLAPFDLFSIGLNCSTGPKEMIPLLNELHAISPCYTSAHPNAGFPDEDGRYTLAPDHLAGELKPLLAAGFLNIVGGCCGTTPDHIRALKRILPASRPRSVPPKKPALLLAGLDPVEVKRDTLLIVGERTNVAGSRIFRRRIERKQWEEALLVARDQIAEGADLLDICMDDPLLDSKEAIISFLRYIASDPTIAKAALMIDSSDWSVIEAALGEVQGRGIVNSISLKEGEELFIRRAKKIASFGHAFVVMLFDEAGQAASYERKLAIAERSYTLLVEAGIDPSSIIFDPNVLAIGTGIAEHDAYAKATIDATRELKKRYPRSYISGGISNLSFAFRGNDPLRSALHEVFLELARFDLAILNPASLHRSTLDEPTRKIVRKALLAGDSSQLLNLALAEQAKERTEVDHAGLTPEELLSKAVIDGELLGLEAVLDSLTHLEPLFIIDSILMEAMKTVGTRFGEGKMFLSQVVRSARAMKNAVDRLQPRLEAQSAEKKSSLGTRKAVLATVKGDVHDIGKNIVALVLSCNNFEVIDLGVMVDEETILNAVKEHNPDLVGLSGLITPSLKEMEKVISLFEAEGLQLPVFVGGATTSEVHTALKLAPLSRGAVIRTKDAGEMALTAVEVLGPQGQARLEAIRTQYEAIRIRYTQEAEPSRGSKEDLLEKQEQKRTSLKAKRYGVFVKDDFDLSELAKRISWRMYVQGWGVPFEDEEAKRIIAEAKELLAREEIASSFERGMKVVYSMMKVKSDRHTISTGRHVFHFLRDEGSGFSLPDMVAQEDAVGFFAASSALDLEAILDDDPVKTLTLKLLADRLAEVLAQEAQSLIADLWTERPRSIIRPAIGYPSWSDHSEKKTLFELLEVKERIGISLSSSYAMNPPSSVCGAVIGGEGVRYFTVKDVSRAQLERYARRKGVPDRELASFLKDMGY